MPINIKLHQALNNFFSEQLNMYGGMPEPVASSEIKETFQFNDFISKAVKIKSVPFGKKGLEYLTEHPLTKEYRFYFERPDNSHLRSHQFLHGLKQLQLKERKEWHTKGVLTFFKLSSEALETAYSNIAQGNSFSPDVFREVAQGLLEIFEIDRNLLMSMVLWENKKECYLSCHGIKSCAVAYHVAAAAGFSKAEILEIGIAALISDLGMVWVTPHLKNKERLNSEEHCEIYKHPILTLHTLHKLEELSPKVIFSAYQHHERQNGVGYPDKKEDGQILPYSKVLAIADIFSAMVSDRDNRRGHLPNIAMINLLKLARTGMLSVQEVIAFCDFVSLYPAGTLVRLNTGQIGRVLHTNYGKYDRPVLSILTDSQETLLSKQKVFTLDLSQESKIHIEQVVPNWVFKPAPLDGIA